ncbi:MAG: hypothetical protein HY062_13865 [Bacteroidetes bacterium]|nr:hypothetical protein [Bacteroidota bacterium]
MNKHLLIAALALCFISCEKEYVCVCRNMATGEKTYGDKVKTTHLGKKGFEKNCKSKSTEFKDCYVEQ